MSLIASPAMKANLPVQQNEAGKERRVVAL